MSAVLPTNRPPANVYEANGQVSVAVPVPGAHPEQTTIELSSDRLMLDAVCKYPQESQHLLRREWKVGRWHLELDLPLRVDPTRAQATLNLGVLVVMAPSATGAHGALRVPISRVHGPS
ncbi:MAG TPA: Hsp20/alpha crystallin family protein [Candidatus Dormibacteraeota bacterium]|nr:Hsp20/alpha crystallin family protein [Candidatus Dormibacteraeota bacterium]